MSPVTCFSSTATPSNEVCAVVISMIGLLIQNELTSCHLLIAYPITSELNKFKMDQSDDTCHTSNVSQAPSLVDDLPCVGYGWRKREGELVNCSDFWGKFSRAMYVSTN